VLHTEIEGSIVRENVPTLRGNYYGFFDGLYNAIRNDDPLPVSAEDGIKVMQIIEVAMESSKHKKYIEF